MKLRIRAHAKINLALSVGATDDDGYHAVNTVLQTVSLADTIRIDTMERVRSRPGPGPHGVADAAHQAPIHLAVHGTELPDDNTIRRAANLMADYVRRQGVETLLPLVFSVNKRIPTGAGLGGGSSDGAAALVGCARFWCRQELMPDREQLARLGARIGADVPFFLWGGTALGRGRGDRIEALAEVRPRWLVLAAPVIAISTMGVYAAFDRQRPDPGPPAPVAYEPRLEAGWMGNDLERVVSRAYPAVASVGRALRSLGAQPVQMSGSGAATFGFFDGRREARRAALALRKRGWWARTCTTVTANQHRRALGF